MLASTPQGTHNLQFRITLWFGCDGFVGQTKIASPNDANTPICTSWAQSDVSWYWTLVVIFRVLVSMHENSSHSFHGFDVILHCVVYTWRGWTTKGEVDDSKCKRGRCSTFDTGSFYVSLVKGGVCETKGAFVNVSRVRGM